MHHRKRWNLAPPHPAAQELADRLKTSPLLAQVLLNRGLEEAQECQDFLRPSLKCLHDPLSIPNLRQAAERLAKAVRDKQKIVIYGDYDVDGITATTILWHAIRVLGGICDFYIPHRIEEGYGLNAEALNQICDAGAQLIVTVDCGVTAVEPAKVARQRGVDLIITDHHELLVDRVVNGQGDKTRGQTDGADELRGPDKETRGQGDKAKEEAALYGVLPVSPCPPVSLSFRLPDCYAVVHPRFPGEGAPYPNTHLCGAGVAFKLAWGLGLAMSGGNRVSSEFRDFLLEATALAALGTIADVVPLVGENRILAHFGLSGLKASRLGGIRALIASAGLTGENLSSFHVGFLLAPRLNASGRMGHARLAVEMLTTAELEKANQIAGYLEQQNRQRQAIEKRILDQAMAQIVDGGWDAEGKCAIVLGDESWHPGVIGIVASRIVDRFHRPTIMVALSNGQGQGSGRSIVGFHLARALEACAQHLEAFGGHEMAAGLRVRTAKFPDFRESFCAQAGQLLSRDMLIPELRLDGLAEAWQMSPALVNDFQRLGPFGHGNPKPLLCLRNLEIASAPRRVGRTGEHLQLSVRQGQNIIRCIGFGYGNLYDHLPIGSRIDLAVEPILNEYNGHTSVELDVRDIQFRQV